MANRSLGSGALVVIWRRQNLDWCSNALRPPLYHLISSQKRLDKMYGMHCTAECAAEWISCTQQCNVDKMHGMHCWMCSTIWNSVARIMGRDIIYWNAMKFYVAKDDWVNIVQCNANANILQCNMIGWHNNVVQHSELRCSCLAIE